MISDAEAHSVFFTLHEHGSFRRSTTVAKDVFKKVDDHGRELCLITPNETGRLARPRQRPARILKDGLKA